MPLQINVYNNAAMNSGARLVELLNSGDRLGELIDWVNQIGGNGQIGSDTVNADILAQYLKFRYRY